MRLILSLALCFVILAHVSICLSGGEYAAGMTYGAMSGAMMGYAMADSRQCGIDDMPSYCKKTETIGAIILTCPKSEIKKEDETIALTVLSGLFIFALLGSGWLIYRLIK